MTTVQVRVTGQVQGVGFRAYAARQAAVHGVTGWVRNESDGSVSALVEGSPAAVDALLADLRTGPRSAVVDSVDTTPATPEGLPDFSVT
ncbi:acylphosphatase [Nocardioides marmoraquaticus]